MVSGGGVSVGGGSGVLVGASVLVGSGVLVGIGGGVLLGSGVKVGNGVSDGAVVDVGIVTKVAVGKKNCGVGDATLTGGKNCGGVGCSGPKAVGENNGVMVGSKVFVGRSRSLPMGVHVGVIVSAAVLRLAGDVPHK